MAKKSNTPAKMESTFACMALPLEFYTRPDVVQVAKELIGKELVTYFEGIVTSGIITETEAYAGINDRASHAFGGKVTSRNKVMYGSAGFAYVYLCYGIHHLFNVVTNTEGIPHAVLIRAVEPIVGVDVMLMRRMKATVTPALTAGPGALSQALGIKTIHSGLSLRGPEITIMDTGSVPRQEQIQTATRVGVAYAGEDALLPYRFYLKDNRFVSKGKGL